MGWDVNVHVNLQMMMILMLMLMLMLMMMMTLMKLVIVTELTSFTNLIRVCAVPRPGTRLYIHTHCITIPVIPEPHTSSPAETTPLTWFRPHPGRKGGLLEHACGDEEPNGTKRTTFIRCLERYLACKYPGYPRNSKDIPGCIFRWDVIVNAFHIIFYSHRW